MSCVKCEEEQAKGDVAYVRMDNANIAILGCDRHVAEVIDTLNHVHAEHIDVPVSGRQVFRVKGVYQVSEKYRE